jgi:tetratricopeptide (TPR) repeat protein
VSEPQPLAEVHADLATAYAEMGLLSDAVIEFERALELDPLCARARAGLSSARARLDGGIPDEPA